MRTTLKMMRRTRNMMTMMKRKRVPRPVALVTAVLTVFLATAFMPAAASAQSTVVVVVRHAETAGGMGGHGH